MKVVHLFKLVVIMLFASLCLSGCGGENKVGTLTLAVTPGDPSGPVFTVSANATYTNPNTTDLVNVPIVFDTVPRMTGFPVTEYTNSSGNAGLLLLFDQDTVPVTFVITAKTGDLQDSKSVTMPAVNTLVATPTTVDLTATASQTVAISGGSGAALSPPSSSDPTNIGAILSGTTVTITKLTSATGTAIVTVTDGTSSVQIGVTF